MRSDLQAILAQAYRAKAMGQGSVEQAVAAFRARREDPTFMKATQAELARVTAVNNSQCFVSKVVMDFLNEALNG